MSDSETRSLIERYLAAYNAGDHDAMLAYLSDDVAHDLNEGGREIGKDKFRWFLGETGGRFRAKVSDILVMTAEDGHRAAAEFTVRGAYVATAAGFPEATGQHFSIAAGSFFEIDEGLISRVTEYHNRTGLAARLREG